MSGWGTFRASWRLWSLYLWVAVLIVAFTPIVLAEVSRVEPGNGT